MISLVLCFFAPFAYDQYVLPKIALAALLVAYTGCHRGFSSKTLTEPLAFILFAILLSATFSGDPLVNFFGHHSARYLGFLPLLICFLAYHLRSGPQSAAKQMRLSGALLGIYGLSQLLWTPLEYKVLMTGHRITGSMGSPPALGCALAMCLSFCLGKDRNSVIITVIVLIAIIMTGSRGPMLAALVAGVLCI